MSNAFMAASVKSKREQATIQKKGRPVQDTEDLVTINVRIPKEMHRRLQFYRIETGENMTQLIRRLLAQELGKDER